MDLGNLEKQIMKGELKDIYSIRFLLNGYKNATKNELKGQVTEEELEIIGDTVDKIVFGISYLLDIYSDKLYKSNLIDNMSAKGLVRKLFEKGDK